VKKSWKTLRLDVPLPRDPRLVEASIAMRQVVMLSAIGTVMLARPWRLVMISGATYSASGNHERMCTSSVVSWDGAEAASFAVDLDETFIARRGDTIADSVLMPLNTNFGLSRRPVRIRCEDVYGDMSHKVLAIAQTAVEHLGSATN
jgi:hypothetical protein